jgi:hypothetical protein
VPGVYYAQKGGLLPGEKQTGIPIIAHGKEFMQPASTVEYYGPGVMEALRRQLIPKDFFSSFASLSPHRPVGHYAEGGLVTERSSLSISVPVNINDPRLASHLRTNIEAVVINTLKEYAR